MYIKTLRDESVISVLNSYPDFRFDVFHNENPDNRYADGDDIR